MRLFFLSYFIFFVSIISIAQVTVIRGEAPGAERRVVRVSVAGDLLTFWDRPLGQARIDSSGRFELQVNLDKTANATISIDFHSAELLLEPSGTYSIKIAPMKYDENTEANPLMQSQNLTLERTGNEAQDLNTLITAFDAVYSEFLTKNFNALYRERRKVLLDTFRVHLNQHFGSVKNSYFLDYATYKIAALEQLTQYYNQAQLAKKYFTDKPVLYNNLEYMEFFNSYFAKYMTITSGTLRKIDLTTLLSAPDPYKSFMKAMAADTILKNEQLRELVMLKGLMELYNTPSVNQHEVLSLLGTVKIRSKFTENRLVADDMICLLTKFKPGTMVPEFTLPDRYQKEFSSKSLLGKPVVLCFWTTWCDPCLAEMDMIRPIYDKYRENVHFVCISADKYFSKMQYFINLKKEYIWTFLHIGNNPDVLINYDVRTYPLFILIDKEGRFYKYPAEQPSGGLENDLQKMLEE